MSQAAARGRPDFIVATVTGMSLPLCEYLKQVDTAVLWRL